MTIIEFNMLTIGIAFDSSSYFRLYAHVIVARKYTTSPIANMIPLP